MRLIPQVILLTILNISVAQSQDVCEAPLRLRAFNEIKESQKYDIALSVRDNLCRREYSSDEEARNAINSNGFSLGYAGYSVGFSQGRQSSNGKISISDSKFCQSSVQDLKSLYQEQYESKITDVAVRAWESCIEKTNQNALYIKYKVDASGMYFNGTLKVSSNGGVIERKVVGITYNGPAKDKVTCKIGGEPIAPSTLKAAEYVLKSTETTFACEKTVDESVSIAIQLNAGASDYITLPSSSSIKTAKVEEVESKLQANMLQIQADIDKRLSSMEKNILNTEIVLAKQANQSIKVAQVPVTFKHSECGTPEGVSPSTHLCRVPLSLGKVKILGAAVGRTIGTSAGNAETIVTLNEVNENFATVFVSRPWSNWVNDPGYHHLTEIFVVYQPVEN